MDSFSARSKYEELLKAPLNEFLVQFTTISGHEGQSSHSPVVVIVLPRRRGHEGEKSEGLRMSMLVIESGQWVSQCGLIRVRVRVRVRKFQSKRS